jgi:hypothetical protein
MKYLSLFILTLLFAACSKQTIQSLSITMSVEEDKTAIRGATFELEIDAVDDDVISQVDIQIPILNISEQFKNINQKEWEYRQSYLVDESTPTGTHEIEITITDANGLVNIKTLNLVVE